MLSVAPGAKSEAAMDAAPGRRCPIRSSMHALHVSSPEDWNKPRGNGIQLFLIKSWMWQMSDLALWMPLSGGWQVPVSFSGWLRKSVEGFS